MANLFVVQAPAQITNSLLRAGSEINFDFKLPDCSGKGVEKGTLVEKIIFSLLQLLEGEVFLPPTKEEKGKKYLSYLDTMLKVDILLKVDDKTILCWQIKSSEYGLKKHLMQNPHVSFRGKDYPSPGVLMIDPDCEKKPLGWKVKFLREVSQVSGVPIKEEVLKALEILQKLKKGNLKEVPTGVLLPVHLVHLTTLGLVQVRGSVIKLL